MRVTVYADVIFLINAFMDLFILWIVSKLVKTKTSIWRMIFGSLIAAFLYCLLLFLPYLHSFYNFLGAVIIISITLLFTFRPKKIKEFLKLLFFSHISAFAVGGTCIAIFYYTNITSFIGEFVTLSISNFSFKLLLASTCFIYIVVKFGTGWFNVNVLNKNKFCKANIYMDGTCVPVTALVDTGSSLVDPITKTPVIVAEFTAIKDLFSQDIRLLFYKDRVDKNINLFEELSKTSLCKRIRMIPFSTLGNENGMLIGFRADKVEFFIEGSPDNYKEDVIVGVYNNDLNSGKGYNALINAEIFN